MGCSSSTKSTHLQLVEEQEYLPLPIIILVASISGNLLIIGLKCRKGWLGAGGQNDKSCLVTRIEKNQATVLGEVLETHSLEILRPA